MYQSSCFYKQLIAIVVASSVAVAGIVPVRSYAGEADDYIENTHKVARERAHSLMNEILIEAMVSAVNSQIKANPEGVKRALEEIQQRLQSQLQQLEPIIAISPDEAKNMTGAELTRLSQSYRKTLTKLRVSQDHIYSIAAEVLPQHSSSFRRNVGGDEQDCCWRSGGTPISKRKRTGSEKDDEGLHRYFKGLSP